MGEYSNTYPDEPEAFTLASIEAGEDKPCIRFFVI